MAPLLLQHGDADEDNSARRKRVVECGDENIQEKTRTGLLSGGSGDMQPIV